MQHLIQGVYYLLYLLYFLYRRKKLLYSYIGSPKGTKPPIFVPHLTYLTFFKFINDLKHANKPIKLIPLAQTIRVLPLYKRLTAAVAHHTLFPMFKDMEKSFYEGPEKN